MMKSIQRLVRNIQSALAVLPARQLRAFNQRRGFAPMESLEGRQMLAANLAWVSPVPSEGFSFTNDVAVDSQGNTYSVGQFEGTVDVDPGAGTTNFVSAFTSGSFNNPTSAFLLKYSPAGALLWSKAWISPSQSTFVSPTAITVDASDRVFVAGSFQGSVDLDPGTGTSNASTTDQQNLFISAFNTDGDFLRTTTFGGSGHDQIEKLAIDSDGNVVAVGLFSNTVDFDPGAGTTSLVGYSNGSGFLARYSATDGSFINAYAFAGNAESSVYSVAVDSTGALIVGGYYRGTLDADPTEGTSSLASTGNSGAGFIVKLTSAGAFTFSLNFPVASTNATDFPYGSINAVDVDTSNNIYFTGQFGGLLDLNPGAGTNNITSGQYSRPFVGSVDNSGAFRWGFDLPASEGEGRDISIASNGETTRVLVSGYFAGTNVDFNPGAAAVKLSSTKKGADATGDAFAWTLTPDGAFVDAFRLGGNGYDDAYAIVPVPGSDSFILGGRFSGTTDFQPTAATVNVVNPAGGQFGANGAYTAKYGPSSGGGGTVTPVFDLAAEVNDSKLPSTLTSGDGKKYTLPITLTNNGNTTLVAGTNIDIQVYLHHNANLDDHSSDILISTLANQSIAGLAANKSKTFNASLLIPNSFGQGNYSFYVKTDTSNDVPNETDETGNNNVQGSKAIVITRGGVDLVPTLDSSKLPAAAISGDGKKISLPITLTNSGNIAADATAKIQIKIFAHRLADGAVHTNDTLVLTLDNQSVARLAVGKTKKITASVLLPIELATAADYQLYVQIDTANAIEERTPLGFSGENNNAATTAENKLVGVTQGFIDLAVAVTTSPALTTFANSAAKKVTVTITITNNGNISTLKTATIGTAIALALAPETTGEPLNLNANYVLGVVAPGKNKKLAKSVTIPAGTPAGTYRIVGSILPTSVGDTNEANNLATSANFTITGVVVP